ncbi:MAG: site-specific DNA-methyltransferase, partial [Endomicrobiia bacterium]
SENWQALNLLLEKYKEKIQTIYIDPPFNKEQDADYLYNVKYKDSTWASMLENRLKLAKDLLSDRGSIFVRCDYNGNWIVRPLMDEVFGKENFRNEVIIRRDTKPSEDISVETESLFLFSKSRNYLFNKNIIKKEKRKFVEFHSPGEPKNKENSYISIDGKRFFPPRGRHWSISKDKVDDLIKKGEIKLEKRIYIDIYGNEQYLMPLRLEVEYKAVTNNWTDIHGYGKITNDLLNNYFPTENSEYLLKRVVESTSNEGDLVLDFFLGSGTTTAVAHKLKRKWIGVEMGEHFWSVVLPRMKKVLFYDKSGISKEKDVKEKYNEKTSGGFFKYHILEQYEDTLDNIELKENKEAEELFKD